MGGLGEVSSRRAFLQLVGGSFVLGQLAPPPRNIAGARLGASHEVGHRLLGSTGSAVGAPDEDERCDVAIVGGGVSGLSAAWRLGGRGLDVRVYELEPFVGGTSSSSDDGVVPHPWGAHYLPAPNLEARPALRLLESMGVLLGWDAAGRPRFDPRVLCHAPEERLFYRGAWHPGLAPREALEEEELAELGRFSDEVDALLERRGSDGRYYFQIPVALSSRDPEALALDRKTMAAWLDERGYVTPFLRWYVRYATLDDFGADPEDVSAWAGLHYFASRKLKTPELEASRYLVWPEGNGRLVRELGERSGASFRTGTLCRGVREEGREVELALEDAATGRARRVRARAAVLAVPAFVARRLVEAPEGVLPVRESSPWLVANLHVHRDIDPNHPWDSVLFGAAGLGYVDASHQLTPPRRDTVLTYFRAYGDADVRASRIALRDASWESLARSVFGDLAPAHPELVHATSRVDLVVWGHAMPRPRVGFLGARPFEERSQLGERTSYAHVDVAGLALFEEAQRSGVRAAEALAAPLGLELGESWC